MANGATSMTPDRSRVVVVTRSWWNEPPRLRHQVTNLLMANGHEVLFVEKPTMGGRGKVREGHPALSASGELVHHQARVARPLTLLNAVAVRASLRRVAAEWADAAVVNFNYDYWMLRDLWPTAPMVTIINDDFLGRSRPWAAAEARWAQRRTLQASDAAFAVSFPLLRQCQADTATAELFLPWLRTPYRPPAPGPRRDILYWGFINDRIDWNIIERLAAAGRVIHFAGPIERSPTAHRVLQSPNVQYHGVASIAELAPVVAKCCASIIPYALERTTLEFTMSNRGFELLGQGLPILYAAFPELLPADPRVIHHCRSPEDYVAAATEAEEGFDSAQPVIEAFLADHTPEIRYRQLSRILWGRGTTT
jgi:hypothetical protein